MHLVAALFFLLILIVGAVVVYAVFFAVWIPAIFVLKVKHKWRNTFVAIPLVGLLYIIGIVALFWHSTQPDVVYENTFGSPPSADVSDIQSKMYYFADYGEVFLQFKCDRGTLDAIIASQNMSIDPNPSPLWSEEPGWWRLGDPSAWPECYTGNDSKKGFGSEQSILVYDLATKQVNYYWQGID